jgi:Domain of unknown function (DUF4383)
MGARTLGLAIGVLYLGLGVPGTLAPYFPGGFVLTLVHLVMGAWGLLAFAGWANAGAFARTAAYVFAILALVGMMRGFDHLMLPLYGPNVWLHLLTAGLAGFIAWGSGERRRFTSADRRRARATPVRLERRHDERRKTPAAA